MSRTLPLSPKIAGSLLAISPFQASHAAEPPVPLPTEPLPQDDSRTFAITP
jgi:hypothetical protein